MSGQRERRHDRLLKVVHQKPGLTVRQLATALKRRPHRVATDTADLTALGILRAERGGVALTYFLQEESA